jgi:hypothetical protein
MTWRAAAPWRRRPRAGWRRPPKRPRAARLRRSLKLRPLRTCRRPCCPRTTPPGGARAPGEHAARCAPCGRACAPVRSWWRCRRLRAAKSRTPRQRTLTGARARGVVCAALRPQAAGQAGVARPRHARQQPAVAARMARPCAAPATLTPHAFSRLFSPPSSFASTFPACACAQVRAGPGAAPLLRLRPQRAPAERRQGAQSAAAGLRHTPAHTHTCRSRCADALAARPCPLLCGAQSYSRDFFIFLCLAIFAARHAPPPARAPARIHTFTHACTDNTRPLAPPTSAQRAWLAARAQDCDAAEPRPDGGVEGVDAGYVFALPLF